MTQNLSAIISNIDIKNRIDNSDPQITELAYDSREVSKGTLFFALKGIHTDGHSYIAMAIESGAQAIIHSDPIENPVDGVVYIQVENSRTAMSPVAAAFHKHPSKRLKVIGITGTDGKSTTVAMIHQLLILSGRKAGFLSTVNFNLGAETQKNYLRQSTPEAIEIHRLLAQMIENGCEYAVVESTSHGLSPLNNRLGDVDYNVAVMTNISHEHLEFHKTLERYVDDKSNLFRMASDGAVVNADDDQADIFRTAASGPVCSYSLEDADADLWAKEIIAEGFSQRVKLGGEADGAEAVLNQPGRFNIENLMGALLGISRLTGDTVSTFLPLVPQLKAAKGRMVPVELGQPFTALVDYAHTPGSFEKLFPILRESTPGKLIAIFGSAGERDVTKRPVQGRIASEYSDIVIVTDEDPRQENADTINAQIAQGCRGLTMGIDLFIINHRPDAIHHGCALAKAGDTVVCLGKGHEGSIIYADGPRDWDEETELRKALKTLGFGE